MTITHEVGKHYYYPGEPFWIYLVKEISTNGSHVNGDIIRVDRDPDDGEIELDECMISSVTVDDGTRLATPHEIEYFKKSITEGAVMPYEVFQEVSTTFPIY